MAKGNILNNAKSFIDRVSRSRRNIPDSTNISEQLTSALDSVIQGITESSLGKAELGKQLDLVEKNSDALKPVLSGVFALLETVSKTIKPSTILSISIGMKLLERVNIDPMLDLINNIDKKLQNNKMIMGYIEPYDPEHPEKSKTASKTNPFVNFSAILDSIMAITKPKTVAALILGTRLLKSVKLEPVWELMSDILVNMDKLLNGKDLEESAKNMAKLTGIVANLKEMITTIGITSMLAMMVAPVAIIGLPLIALLLGSTMLIVRKMASFSEDQQKSIVEGRKAILAIGATFTLFALTMLLIGEAAVDPELWGGLLAFTALVGAAVGLLFILSREKMKNLARDGALNILVIGATFSLFALTIILIGEAAMDENTWEGFGMFALMVGTAIILLLFIKSGEKPVRDGALVLLSIGASFALFALTVILLGEAAIESWEGFGMFAAIVGVAVATVLLLSSAKEFVIPGSIALAVIAGSYILFIGVMTLLQALNVGEDMWFNFARMLGVVAIAGAVCAGLGAISWLIIPGAIALGSIVAALLLASVSLLAVSNILPHIQWDALTEGLGQIMIVIGMLAIVGVEALIVSIITIPAFAALLAISTSLIVVSTSLLLAFKVLDTIDWTALVNYIKSKDSGLLGLIGAFRSVFEGMKLKDLIAIPAVCGALIPISVALERLGRGLKSISELDVDLNTVTDNAKNMITVLIEAFVELTERDEIKDLIKDEIANGGNLFRRGRSKTSAVINIARAVSRTVSELATGVANLANCTVTMYDKNGREIGKRQLTDADFALAGNNVGKITTQIITDIKGLAADKEIKEMIKGGGFLGLGDSTAARILNVASQVGGILGDFAENVALFAESKFKNANGELVELSEDSYATASNNIGKLIRSCIGQFAGKEGKSLEVDDKRLNAIKTIGESLGDVTNVVNKVDISKLEKMTTLVDTILKFGNGINFNLDGLANVINGKLINTLQELKEVLEEVNKIFTNFDTSELGGKSSSNIPINPVTGESSSEDSRVDSRRDDGRNNNLVKSINTTVSTIKTEIQKLTRIIDGNDGLKVEITNTPLRVDASKSR